MTYSFNLIDQPWVPCVAPNGQVEDLSLRDALARAHEFRELGGESPLVTAALYRLLLAILHRVYGPPGRDAWRDLWERGHWQEAPLRQYLAQWRHRFDLFDAERPFYQASHRIPENRVGDLLHELCKADTFFDHRTRDGVALSPSEAARHVVTAQAFGRWMTKGPYGQLPFGACARGVIFFAKGGNLFEDLALNLVRYPTREDWLPCDQTKDAPCWEMDDAFESERGTAYGYLDYLTWQSRRILLLPKDQDGLITVRFAKIAPGLRMTDEMRNPAMQHKGRTKKGWKSWVAFREDRALWRDSATILQLPPPTGQDAQDSLPPIVLEWLATLVSNGEIDVSQTRRLAGMGMAGDLNQYRVHFYRREEFPLPLAYLSNRDLVLHLEQAITLSEEARNQLWGALSSLAVELLFHREAQALGKPQRDERDRLLRSWGAERHYWAALELPFYTLLADLPRDAQPARAAWAAVVRRAAWQALEGAIAGLGEDPATLKAAVMARGQLGNGLHKAFEHWPTTHQREVNHAG